jgi:hypothetical protein
VTTTIMKMMMMMMMMMINTKKKSKMDKRHVATETCPYLANDFRLESDQKIKEISTEILSILNIKISESEYMPYSKCYTNTFQ